MSSQPPGARLLQGRSTIGVVLLYACFAALWILLSDHLLELTLSNPDLLLLASTLKGWLFVAVTSGLLYWLMQRQQRAPEQPRPTLSRRRTLTIIALLALSVGTIVSLSIWHSLSEERARAAAQLQTIAASKAREIAGWHIERMRDASWAQKSQGLRDAWLQWQEGRRDAQALRLRQFLTTFFVNDTVYTQVEIIDVEGQRLFGSELRAPQGNAPAATSAPPVLHQGVLEALTGNRPLRVGPWRNAQGRLQISFIAPLAAESHRPAAVVLHHEPSEYLHPTLRDWPVPQQTAETLLFRADDDDGVFMLSALRHDRDAALRLHLPATQRDVMSVRVVRGEVHPGALIEGLDYRGVRSYGVAQRIEGTEWWLLAKQDRAELMHTALIKSAWMVLAGTLALLTLGGALYLLEERRRLADSVRENEELRRIERSLSESEAQYRLLAENTSDVLWLYDLAQDHYLYLSPSVQQQLGYTPQEMLALSLDRVVCAEELPRLRTGLARRLQAFADGDESRRTVSHETTHRHKDGHKVPLEIVSTLVADEQGRVTRLMGISRDISQRRQAQAQLIQLSQAIEQSPASVIITGLDGHIEYVNQAFERISGYPRDEVLGRTPALLRSERTPAEVYPAMWAALQAGQAWTGELINRHKSGRDYVLNMNVAPVRSPDGQITHYLAVQLDVTAQKDAEQLAHQLAWFHPLTNLPNRHRLLLDLQEMVQAHGRTGEIGALLLLNLDRFQTVNDALGHAAGDQLLKQVGERLGRLLPPSDRLAHLSADEFAVLHHCGATDVEAASAQALRLAQALHEQLDPAFTLDHGDPFTISGCIGISLLPKVAGESPVDILRRADTALHRAKDAGARQTAFFDASMEQLIMRRFAIEQDLRRGIVAHELRLYLQPQVDASGRMVGAEALVRWQHPVHGLMTPGSFIPVAEESELITELGRWVLKRVCQHLGALRHDGLRLPISVNISPRQFHQPGFVHVVQDLLQAHEADAADLVIEITEGIVMDQMDSVVRKMAHLHSIGVRFSLDDFGTGYSSLAYLKRLPIHELKIDRSFVQDAPNDPNDAALVEAMLSVARHLRLKVVAEGVETPEQAAFLNAHGDVIQQGYLHGRPEPAEELLARWRASQSSAA